MNGGLLGLLDPSVQLGLFCPQTKSLFIWPNFTLVWMAPSLLCCSGEDWYTNCFYEFSISLLASVYVSLSRQHNALLRPSWACFSARNVTGYILLMMIDIWLSVGKRTALRSWFGQRLSLRRVSKCVLQPLTSNTSQSLSDISLKLPCVLLVFRFFAQRVSSQGLL